ncbi:MAG: hypothetical protein FWB72_02070 [Firmicutes bacterium]|nr:hypothetical protein [Bacillota bacterium]
MSKLEFRESKVLKLNNVLARQVPEKEVFAQDKQVEFLHNWISAKGYETVGPLIMYSSGVKGTRADGSPVIDSRILVQLKEDNIKLEPPYLFDKELKVDNCLFVRFNDNADNLKFATMKLQLHSYENNLEVTGETYIVLVKEESNQILADVFMPLKK